MKAALSMLALILGAAAFSSLVARADDAPAPAPAASPDALTDADVSALLSTSLDKNSSLSVAALQSLLKTLLQSDPELAKFLSEAAAHPGMIAKVLPTALAGETPSTAALAAQPSGENADAQRTAREELVQAQAMADAALASRAASDASSASPEAPSSASADSSTRHYTAGDLVDSSHSLAPDPSDTTHHSMSDLIDHL